MTVITDEVWSEIVTSDRIPDAARGEAEALVKSYKYAEWQPYELTDHVTKKLLDDAIADANKLRDTLERLALREDYRCYNTKDVPVSLEPLQQVRNSIEPLLQRFASDRVRLRKPHARNLQQKWLYRLAHGLFEIRRRYLQTPYPLQPNETKQSGKFRTYISHCLRCAGLPESKIDETIVWITGLYAKEPKRNW